MRSHILLSSLIVAAAAPGHAQSLSQQVRAANGTIQVLYPSRPNVCGDGQGSISNVIGHAELSSYSDGNAGGWRSRACEHGPARLVLTVLGGEVTRARVYVGRVPPSVNDVRTISVGASDAESWLAEMVERGSPRVASQLLLPLMLVEGSEPWKLLLKLARDESRPTEFKRSAMMWLSNAVSDHLGILDDVDRTDDDEMRAQAVFVLSQRPKGESVPALIDVARTSTHASARRAAIYWLGQTGDPRAVDVYAELLGLR